MPKCLPEWPGDVNTTKDPAAEMENSTNAEPYVRIFQYAVYTPSFLFGLMINLIALWLLLFKIKKYTVPAIYMANMIITDILLLFSLPFKVYSFLDKMLDWRFCKFLESLYFVNTYGTILLITLIAIDRYIALKHPFTATVYRSPIKATIICTVLWIAVWSASIPNYFTDTKDTRHCFVNFDTFWDRGGIPMTMEAVFVICTVITMFCSIQIIRTLRRSIIDADENGNRVTSVRIIFSNLMVFLLCFAPYHIAMLLYFLQKQCLIREMAGLRSILQMCQCFANINCCLDAIYYYFVFKEFMKSKLKDHKGDTLVMS